MGQIVYIRGRAVCVQREMSPGIDFSGIFQCILTLTCFYIPKYTFGMYEAERKYPVIKKISTKRHQE